MRVPIATYRMQLRSGITLERTAELLDYMHRLGASDLYLSPPFEAERESTHGYDLVSHQRIDDAIGGEGGLEALGRAARERGMGIIIDWVPNHMSVASERNAWWNDVLTYGQASPYADHFDIDWARPQPALTGMLLLPILGEPYGRVLERGELKIERDGGRVRLRYWERTLPLSPSTLSPLIERAAKELPDGPARSEALAVAEALSRLPGPRTEPPAEPADIERARALEAQLSDRLLRDSTFAAALDGVLAQMNGTPGDPSSFDRLDALIDQQAYRPSAWRLALEAINYRRFFDVDHLAAVRMELPRVFEAAHRHLLLLIERGLVTGLRLDHVDGLADPAGYIRALQERQRDESGPRPIYLLVEKILGAGEALRTDWEVSGTTGYEHARAITGVLVDPRGQRRLEAFYRRFTGDSRPFAEHVRGAKLTVLRTTFASEVRALSDELERIAALDRTYRDLTPSALRGAIEHFVAAFPVYRSYGAADGSRSPEDDALIARALRAARRHSPEQVGDALDLLASILAAQPIEPGEPRSRFVLKLQQLTGPATAKAVEDTAFYRYVPLLCANEVGSEPDHPSLELSAFHSENLEHARRWPSSMVATSTHDTKRGEDARARIAVLSELTGRGPKRRWRRELSRWSRRARGKRTTLEGGQEAPSRRDEYMFWQALVGAWPFDGEVDGHGLSARMAAFMEKAMREAKEHTSWVRPDAEYEMAVRAFVDKTLSDDRVRADVAALDDEIRNAAVSNCLAQVLLRRTVPGVPDLYNGSELWNQSLVDPDNRRPADFDCMNRLLSAIERGEMDPGEALRSPGDGRIKLLVTHRALTLRRQLAELYQRGTYEPLDGGEHVIAFARRLEGQTAITVVTRFPHRLAGSDVPVGGVWADRRLTGPALEPGADYLDVLTGARHTVGGADGLGLSQVLATLPCALLSLLHDT